MEKFRYQRIVSGVLIGGVSLAGCGVYAQLDEARPAVVIDHEYDDEDSWVTYTKIGQVTVPITHTDPEHFNLSLRQCGHSDLSSEDNPDGCGVFNLEVSEGQFYSISDGESVVVSQLESNYE